MYKRNLFQKNRRRQKRGLKPRTPESQIAAWQSKFRFNRIASLTIY